MSSDALPVPHATSIFFRPNMSLSTYPLTVNGSTLSGLLTPQGGHVLAFATCFGVNVWQTISGGVAFKVSRLRVSFRCERQRS